MMGPHHLNEVFFDDLQGHRGRCARHRATRAGRSCRTWCPSSASASRATRAASGYYTAAPEVLGDQWERPARGTAGPVGADADALSPGPADGVPGGVDCRATGRVNPGDSAAYRIAVTKLDQESAEVLMEIAAALPRGGDRRAE